MRIALLWIRCANPDGRGSRKNAKTPRRQEGRGGLQRGRAPGTRRSRAAMNAGHEALASTVWGPAARPARGPDGRRVRTRELLSRLDPPPVRGGCQRQPPGPARPLTRPCDGLASWRLGVSTSGSRAVRIMGAMHPPQTAPPAAPGTSRPPDGSVCGLTPASRAGGARARPCARQSGPPSRGLSGGRSEPLPARRADTTSPPRPLARRERTDSRHRTRCRA